MKREPVLLEIERLEVDGCGYDADGRHAVFGSLPGERVTAVPISRRRKRLYLRTTEVESASAHRVTPICEAAAYCGGCSFQHVAHDHQLVLKADYVRNCLAPLTAEQWLPPIQGSTSHYRSKARLGVKYVDKKQRMLVGFREKLKPYIAEIDRCPVLIKPVSDLLGALAATIEQLSVAKAIPQIELASGESETALIFRHLEPLTPEDEASLQAFGLEHDFQIFLQPGGVDTTHRIHPAAGEALLHYSLPAYELNFEFSPQDFTQVNLDVNRQMVDQALSLLALSPDDHVLDAFCGIGNFSLAIARDAGQVLGLESSAPSVARAAQNARNNQIKNVSFEVADLHAESHEIKGLQGINKVLLDPPRSGAESLVKTLARSNIERVVYVSCNPETLARDAKILVEQGFRLGCAGIIDMFPHTTHVESIALFVRD